MPSVTISPNRTTEVVSMADTTSDTINSPTRGLIGVVVPAGENGKSLTVQASFDGGSTFVPIEEADGNEWSYTLLATSELVMVPEDYKHLTTFRFVLNTSISSTKNFTALLAYV